MGHLDEKTAKNGYLNVPFSQKLLFKDKKLSNTTIKLFWYEVGIAINVYYR